MQLLKSFRRAPAAAGAPPPPRERRRTEHRLLILFCIGALSLVLVVAATAAVRSDAAAGLCAYHEGTTANGTVATSTFHVVRDGCTVSLVSVEHFASGPTIFDTATARNLNASETRYTLSVNLACGTNTQADLVLGEAVLFPDAAFDLQATPFRIECPTAPAPAPAPAPAAAAPAPAAPAPAAPAPVAPTPVATPTPTPTKVGQKPTGAKKKTTEHASATSTKQTTKKPVQPSAKKQHGGVLGAKTSQNLPFTK